MRLFIAASFPPPLIAALSERLQPLRERLPPASWVRPETQHLTFAFLGEQDQALLDRIAPPLESRLQTEAPFTATLSGCGFFPSAGRARVGWVGLDPEEPFARVAQAVGAILKREGLQPDHDRFRPHLTLMRMRERWRPAAISALQEALHDYRSQPFLVDRVTLYSSRLSPKGATHSALRHFPLGTASV